MTEPAATPTTLRLGGCRCGRVRFEVTAAPLLTMACHCTGCQRMSASAFSLSALFPAAAFRVTTGAPVIGGMHDPAIRHHHCDFCKSWLYTIPAGLEAFVNVRTTMLDDAADLAPFMETMTDEKLPWATTPAVVSYARFPGAEEWAAVMGRYGAATGSR